MGINNFSNVLFSKAQQHVLGLLYGNPDRDFYTNEIIRLADSGTGAVQRELTKLTKAGLIDMKCIGNQKHYKANPSCPVFKELRGIVLKTFGLTNLLQEALQPLLGQIQFAFIYGSIAKQEDTANSDIDLMIISETLTYGDVFSLLEQIEIKLNRKIHPTLYSLSEWIRKLKQNNNFVTQIIKQPKIFLIGTEDEFNEVR